MPGNRTDQGSAIFIVLAAGAGTRWSGAGHKLEARISDGRSVLRASLDAALTAASRCDASVVLVVGADDHASALGDQGAAPGPLEVVSNPHWQSGQRSSLLVGLDCADAHGADAAVIGLADQPFVTPEAWISLAASASPIAIATYEGKRGHPVRLARELWPSFRSLGSPADEGLRSFIGLHPELTEEVPCEGSPIDIDTVEDLDRWT